MQGSEYAPWLFDFIITLAAEVRVKVFSQTLREGDSSPGLGINCTSNLGRSLIRSELVLNSCYFPSMLPPSVEWLPFYPHISLTSAQMFKGVQETSDVPSL